MSSYYETVDGVRCDRGIIDACREAVNGRGDGRVSMDDARKVFEAIADGGKVTQAERWTLRYCLTAFDFTQAAQDWLIEECKKLKQENADDEPLAKRPRVAGESRYEKIDGVDLDRTIVDKCRAAVDDKTYGRIWLDDAKKIFKEVEDDNKVSRGERWTIRYCLLEFNWTEAAQEWFVNALKDVPQER